LVSHLDRAKGLRNRFFESPVPLSFLVCFRSRVLFDETGSGSWYGSGMATAGGGKRRGDFGRFDSIEELAS
jgi:hypothetical protein